MKLFLFSAFFLSQAFVVAPTKAMEFFVLSGTSSVTVGTQTDPDAFAAELERVSTQHKQEIQRMREEIQWMKDDHEMALRDARGQAMLDILVFQESRSSLSLDS